MGGSTGKVRPIKGKVKKKARVARPRDKKKEPPAVVVLTPCYFCQKKVDEKEYLCAGCDQVVCEECEANVPWGDHEPEAHHEEEGEDD